LIIGIFILRTEIDRTCLDIAVGDSRFFEGRDHRCRATGIFRHGLGGRTRLRHDTGPDLGDIGNLTDIAGRDNIQAGAGENRLRQNLRLRRKWHRRCE